MKFNKSAESEKYYVGYDNDRFAGEIVVLHNPKECVFYSNENGLRKNDLKQIQDKIEEIERESGVDTTSTFTSNSDIK